MDINNIGSPSLKQTTAVKCEKCGCETFIPSYMLRRVSKLLIGESQDGIIPINTFSCAKCGHVNKEFIPKELAEETKEEKTNMIIQ